MTEFVALLRGVNVGGVTIRMAELADTVRGIGFEGVSTVLASGNVLFSTSDSAAAATGKLEAALRERFGYEAWVHVLTLPALQEIVDDYPFERARDGWHDYVVIAVDPDARAELGAVAERLDPERESAELGHGVLYWTVEKGRTLDSVMGKAQAKAKLKRWITARNVNTLERLLP